MAQQNMRVCGRTAIMQQCSRQQPSSPCSGGPHACFCGLVRRIFGPMPCGPRTLRGFVGLLFTVCRRLVVCRYMCMYECTNAIAFTTIIPILDPSHQLAQNTVLLYLDLVREVCPTPRTCPTLVWYSIRYEIAIQTRLYHVR